MTQCLRLGLLFALSLSAGCSAPPLLLVANDLSAAPLPPPPPPGSADSCTKILNQNGKISRPGLEFLTSVPPRSPLDQVHTVLGVPFCQLPSGSIQIDGQLMPAIRAAYPAEWDSGLNIVIFVEPDPPTYLGYDFAILRPSGGGI